MSCLNVTVGNFSSQICYLTTFIKGTVHPKKKITYIIFYQMNGVEEKVQCFPPKCKMLKIVLKYSTWVNVLCYWMYVLTITCQMANHKEHWLQLSISFYVVIVLTVPHRHIKVLWWHQYTSTNIWHVEKKKKTLLWGKDPISLINRSMLQLVRGELVSWWQVVSNSILQFVRLREGRASVSANGANGDDDTSLLLTV